MKLPPMVICKCREENHAWLIRARDEKYNQVAWCRTCCVLRKVRDERQAPLQFSAPRIVAKEGNFDIRMQELPAFERVALNDAAVSFKRLGGWK